MTNFERIKGMGIEELAAMLDGECQFCAYFGKECIYNSEMHCDEGVLKWLKNKYDEDDYEVDE